MGATFAKSTRFEDDLQVEFTDPTGLIVLKGEDGETFNTGSEDGANTGSSSSGEGKTVTPEVVSGAKVQIANSQLIDAQEDLARINAERARLEIQREKLYDSLDSLYWDNLQATVQHEITLLTALGEFTHGNGQPIAEKLWDDLNTDSGRQTQKTLRSEIEILSSAYLMTQNISALRKASSSGQAEVRRLQGLLNTYSGE